jgi:TrmH family RNA methyltransferase
MKNMSCVELRIVGEKETFADTQVRTLAVHAADIWESAVFYEPTPDGLRKATADCTVSAGTTRRMGQKRKSWGMTPEQFAATMQEAGAAKIAIVFGNERTGLTDEELDCCSVAINIPSSDAFPSLNLSHAVQVVTYELFRAFDGKTRGYVPISRERLAEIMESVSASIERAGLFRIAGKDDNDRFLESVLARAALSESEAQRMEKLFRAMAWAKTGSDRSE